MSNKTISLPDIRPAGGTFSAGQGYLFGAVAMPTHVVLTDHGRGTRYCLGGFGSEAKAISAWRRLKSLYGSGNASCWIEPIPQA